MSIWMCSNSLCLYFRQLIVLFQSILSCAKRFFHSICISQEICCVIETGITKEKWMNGLTTKIQEKCHKRLSETYSPKRMGQFGRDRSTLMRIPIFLTNKTSNGRWIINNSYLQKCTLPTLSGTDNSSRDKSTGTCLRFKNAQISNTLFILMKLSKRQKMEP